MSIDINWETLTQGPDGEALAESVRAFIDDKFQKITLPRMIRSVKVHSFDFGQVPPQIDLKDVCEPLPDFYEGEEEDDSEDDDGDSAVRSSVAGSDGGHENDHHSNNLKDRDSSVRRQTNTNRFERGNNLPVHLNADSGLLDHHHRPRDDIASSHLLARATTPGILGGTSNFGYFHLPLSAGLSGTTTPLAAVAGAQFNNTMHDVDRSRRSNEIDHSDHHRTTSFGSPTPSSATTHSSRPTSRHHQDWPGGTPHGLSAAGDHVDVRDSRDEEHPERSVEDVQIVLHVTYSGDIKLSLTAEILLDYPMPSFVGIPLQLTITGLTFDGVAILAYIKKKAHFCFLCPEDAEALVGNTAADDDDNDIDGELDGTTAERRKSTAAAAAAGALLEEIKVESEIGQRESGKQVLKNVGKVEKFVLEQVRRIFDEEFVYPSFWTFLV